jgi:lipopolysaccharide cholinephosphotransferase
MLGEKEHIEDFILFRNLIKEIGIGYVIYFGTLLGAKRDKALIPWDDDIDFVIYEGVEKIPALELLLIERQFVKIRHEGDIITYERNNIRFDLYIFKLKFINYKCNDYVIPRQYLKNVESINMYGVNFAAPENSTKVLMSLYGLSWKIPDENLSASPISFNYRVKLFLKHKVIPVNVYNFIRNIVKG